MMRVILLENIKNLGKVGDLINVKPGFARNFLLPQEKAAIATKVNLAYFEKRRAELEKAAEDKAAAAKSRAEKLKDVVLTISAQASDEGKLFGSVGPREIVEAASAANIEIEKKEVNLPEGPIRLVGEHQIELQILNDINVAIMLNIEAIKADVDA